jgi:hypothetical protein
MPGAGAVHHLTTGLIAVKRHPFDQLVRSAQDVRWQCKAESLEALAKLQPHTQRRSAEPVEVLLA